MKLVLDKVQAILDNKNITYGDIVNFTGMSKGAIRPYRIGERPITKMQIENALKFQELYDEKQKEMEIMKYENLQFVHFDRDNGIYELEFNSDGETEFITVQASDHPEAATDEYYFDDKEVVDRIIMDIPED